MPCPAADPFRPERSAICSFDRGHRRSRATSLTPETPLRTDRNGLSAGFVIAIEHGTITAIGFKASTCVTLVAYCELMVEITEFLTVVEAWAEAEVD